VALVADGVMVVAGVGAVAVEISGVIGTAGAVGWTRVRRAGVRHTLHGGHGIVSGLVAVAIEIRGLIGRARAVDGRTGIGGAARRQACIRGGVVEVVVLGAVARELSGVVGSAGGVGRSARIGGAGTEQALVGIGPVEVVGLGAVAGELGGVRRKAGGVDGGTRIGDAGVGQTLVGGGVVEVVGVGAVAVKFAGANVITQAAGGTGVRAAGWAEQGEGKGKEGEVRTNHEWGFLLWRKGKKFYDLGYSLRRRKWLEGEHGVAEESRKQDTRTTTTRRRTWLRGVLVTIVGLNLI